MNHAFPDKLWITIAIVISTFITFISVNSDILFLAVVPHILLLIFVLSLCFGVIKVAYLISFFISPLFLIVSGSILGFGKVELFLLLIVPIIPVLVTNRDINKNLGNLPFVFSTVVVIFSVLFSQMWTVLKYKSEWSFTLFYNIKLLLGFVAFYSLYICLNSKKINTVSILKTMCFSGFFVMIVLYAKIILLDGFGSIINNRLGFSININPNLISSTLDILFPIAAGLFFYEKTFFKRLIFGSISVLFILSILFTYSRGSLLGLAAIILILFLKKITKLKVVAVIIGIFLYIIIFGQQIENRFSIEDPKTAASNLGRISLLKTSFKMIKDNYYVLGAGMNTFSVVKFKYGFPSWFDTKKSMSTHNMYVEVIVGIGLIGFFAFAWIIFKPFGELFFLKGPSDQMPLQNGIFYSLLMFLIHNLVECSIFYFEIWYMVMSILAIAVYFVNKNKRMPKDFNPEIAVS